MQLPCVILNNNLCIVSVPRFMVKVEVPHKDVGACPGTRIYELVNIERLETVVYIVDRNFTGGCRKPQCGDQIGVLIIVGGHSPISGWDRTVHIEYYSLFQQRVFGPRLL